MKLAFGTLNKTIAKTILANAPKYSKIVEPFGDGGSIAFESAKKKPKEHILNVFNVELFTAFQFVQSYNGADFAKLKKFDWVGSQETFDAVVKISAINGADAFYKFFYLKKFGMSMSPDEPLTFDILSIGKDLKPLLYSLPVMRVALKGVTITNVDPISLIGSGGGDTFYILLPKTPEDVQATRSKLTGLGGNFFFASKVKGVEDILNDASSYSGLVVSPLSVASIMMNKMSVISNYESKLTSIDLEIQGTSKTSKMKM